MKKVLIIEDDHDIGDITEMALNSKYNTLVKRDASQLIQVIQQFMPDVVLIDNFIGHKNATEIIEEIKSAGINLNIPMILFSAHQDIEIIATQIGAADFIAKPFDLYELHQCINRVLSPDIKKIIHRF